MKIATLTVVMLLAIAPLCIAQNVPQPPTPSPAPAPAYKTMSRDELEAAYIEKLEESAQLRRELAAAQKQIKELAEKIEADKPKEATAETTTVKPMTIAEAIKAHVLIEGMTVEQANQAVGTNPKKIDRYNPSGTWKDSSGKLRSEREMARWPIITQKTMANPTGITGQWVAFVYKNKIVAVERMDGPERPMTIQWPDTPIE